MLRGGTREAAQTLSGFFVLGVAGWFLSAAAALPILYASLRLAIDHAAGVRRRLPA
jgi:ABC-type transport system involved in cytochrome bd biosynthesis fused ATPase/permease subunit